MTQKLTILLASLNGYENINSYLGLAEELKERGHRLVFIIDHKLKGQLINYGFEEELIELPENGNSTDVTEYTELLKQSPIELIDSFYIKSSKKILKNIETLNEDYKQIIDNVKPDIIIIDSQICSPALTQSGIPWVWLNCSAPHMWFFEGRIPPAWSGFPKTGDRNKWIAFKKEWNEKYNELRKNLNNWLTHKGVQELPPNTIHEQSKYLNIYIYPQELDYHELQPLPDNWLQVDCFMRTSDEIFSIPQELKTKLGKLVLMSLGSFGSSDLELMKRITGLLAKSENRFIVSKGPFHDRYELPDNMWGQKELPESQILPLVDLVITHGGNNAITQAFYYGKPMIAMPFFADQLDNAQRIKELGFGITLNPYSCGQTVLIGSVDAMLADQRLKHRMGLISDRIQKSNCKKRAANLIENILHTNEA